MASPRPPCFPQDLEKYKSSKVDALANATIEHVVGGRQAQRFQGGCEGRPEREGCHLGVLSLDMAWVPRRSCPLS